MQLVRQLERVTPSLVVDDGRRNHHECCRFGERVFEIVASIRPARFRRFRGTPQLGILGAVISPTPQDRQIRMARKKVAAKKNDAKKSGANVGFEGELWRAADAPAVQHGRGRVQARRARADLPQVHLRRLRGAARQARSREQERGRPRRPRRIPGRSTSSGCRRRPAGRIFAAGPRTRRSARSSTTPCSPSSATTPRSRACCPRTTPTPRLDKQRLGQLIDLVGNIGLGDKENRSKDILGRVYEYFLSQFASAEGKKGGQFYTPRCVVQRAGRDARPVQGPRVRSVLRLGRHVRAVAQVRRGPHQR